MPKRLDYNSKLNYLQAIDSKIIVDILIYQLYKNTYFGLKAYFAKNFMEKLQ